MHNKGHGEFLRMSNISRSHVTIKCLFLKTPLGLLYNEAIFSEIKLKKSAIIIVILSQWYVVKDKQIINKSLFHSE